MTGHSVSAVWSKRALEDLIAIEASVAVDAPTVANRPALRQKTAGDGLGEFPLRGRPRGAVRELTAVKPYILRYRIEADEVRILRVRHGARRPPH